MLVRLVTTVVAAALLAGCSTEEGLRAQELLQRAEAAQAELRSSTFDGSMSIAAEGMSMRVIFDGATSAEGEWVSMRTTGVPEGDVAMEVLHRGERFWIDSGDGWKPAPPGLAGSGGTMDAAAFQQLARHVKDVRVSEHQLIDGEPVTTIAGSIDTQGLIESAAQLGSLAPSGFDLSDAGIDFGDIEAVLTIDERTGLLDAALVTFSMSAAGKTLEMQVRYRLASANQPVELPRP